MKPLFIILLTISLYSCSPKYGCGTESYRRSFRVERIHRDRTGQYIVTLRNSWNEKRYMVCCSLPDSVKQGNYVTL